MALNTPKRIKTLQTFINSPSSDCGSIWRDYSGASDGGSGGVGSGGGGAITIHEHQLGESNGNNVTNAGHATTGSLSPASSCDSPEFNIRHPNNGTINNVYNMYGADARENRRGRPRSEALTTLMIEGSTSPSAIKCTYCNRVFPREKSLQAHLRTHTGERPYLCDYPGCTRAFTQSGQLKTHQRLHTGERPFMCSAPTCQMRFTHANRHCPEHPYDQLKRCDDFIIQAVTEQNHEVIKWLEKYKMEKEDRTPTRKTPKRASTIIGTSDKSNENYNANACTENQLPVTPSNPYKSRKGLMVELDMNAGLGASPLTGAKMKPTPKVIRWQEPLSQEEDSADEYEMPARSTFNPKKRWLREAWQDDLAKPLEPITHAPTHSNPNENVYECASKLMPLPPVKTKSPPLNPNQMRPTVLMVASKDRTMPLLSISANIADNNETIKQNESQPKSSTSNYHRNTNISADAIGGSTLTNYDYDHHHLHKQHHQQQQQQQQPLSFIDLSSTVSSASLDIYSTETTPNNRTNMSTITAHLDASSPAVSLDTGKNRKWLGALALMQLATDETNSSNSHTTSSSSAMSSLSASPILSINDDTTKASFTVL